MDLPLFEKFRRIETPKIPGLEKAQAYILGECSVIVNVEEGRYHLSIAHPSRYPTWDEIKEAREYLLPIGKWFVMVFPPPQHYVNIHRNCFHLWESRDAEMMEICAEGGRRG